MHFQNAKQYSHAARNHKNAPPSASFLTFKKFDEPEVPFQGQVTKVRIKRGALTVAPGPMVSIDKNVPRS